MTATKIQLPEHGLSLQFVTAESSDIDWREASGLGVEGYSIMLPTPTYQDVAERDPGLLEEWREEADQVECGQCEGTGTTDAMGHSEECPVCDGTGLIDDKNACPDDQPLSSAHAEHFEQTRAYDEWRDSFEPMMSYVWPVSLAYGMHDLQAVANAIEQFAGNVTLVELSDEAKRVAFGDGSDAPDYGLALNGGGMDLSDHLVGAYLCCGCVPPIQLLERMPGVMSNGRRDSMREALDAAYERAIDWLGERQKRLSNACSVLMKD